MSEILKESGDEYQSCSSIPIQLPSPPLHSNLPLLPISLNISSKDIISQDFTSQMTTLPALTLLSIAANNKISSNPPEDVKSEDDSCTEHKKALLKCKLCWEETPEECMYKLSNCQCSFCSKCLKEYLVLNIQEGNVHVIECPDHDCHFQGTFQSNEVQDLVGADLFKKYKKIKFQNEIDLNPFQSFCPSRHCDTIITLPREDFDRHKHFTSRPALCHRCGFKFCVLCKEAWHEGSSCVENIKQLQTLASFDGIRYDESEDAQIKRCPFCFLPIERDGGCAQVKCKKCNHIFCWFCLTCLDRDALFFHFERGPCKDKLGHSRASIIWHRIQVVTIFAGVGLLVLLASPFLLLAAPCVVCCKFKSAREQSKRKRKKKMTEARLSTTKKLSQNGKEDTLVMIGLPDGENNDGEGEVI